MLAPVYASGARLCARIFTKIFVVGGLWQVVAHVDEHRGQDQHGGEVHRDHSL